MKQIITLRSLVLCVSIALCLGIVLPLQSHAAVFSGAGLSDSLGSVQVPHGDLGGIIVKIVNRADAPQDLAIEIAGVSSIANEGTATVLKADNRDVTNSLNDPKHVVPATETVTGLGTSFTRSYPPCSITILELTAK